MQYLKYFALVSISYLFGGCISEVTFDVEEPPSNIVVYGRITNDPRPHELTISYTGRLVDNEAQLPVIGAVVSLQDDLGNMEPYTEVSNGRYMLAQDVVKGVPGRTYILDIILPGGRAIRSRAETMPQPVPVDSVYASNNSTVQLTAYVDTKIPPGGNTWLRWESDRIRMLREINKNVVLMMPFAPPPNVCYLWSPYSRQLPNLFHTEEQAGYQLTGQEVGNSRIDSKFYQRNCIQVYQLSTTAASYEYWRDVQKAANPQGTIFDTPPAPLSGNLFYLNDENETVFGFFEAAAVDTGRVFVSRDELVDVVFEDPCTRDYARYSFNDFGFPKECLNCLIVPGTTLEVPWFW